MKISSMEIDYEFYLLTFDMSLLVNSVFDTVIFNFVREVKTASGDVLVSKYVGLLELSA